MMKLTIFASLFLFNLFACGEARRPETPGSPPAANVPANSVEAAESSAEAPTAAGSQTGPRTIREFFTLLPEKYFTLEGCDRATDKDCKKARAEYLKTFTEVEDTANGYFKGGCDGGQACIEMAIFKRPDNTYLVGVATFAEMMNDFYFLDYSAGKWTDVSAQVVPAFAKGNWYELPRVGTTMKVYRKKITEKTNEFEISEKGEYLYSLAWKNGKFVR